jgi:hypothetical protein
MLIANKEYEYKECFIFNGVSLVSVFSHNQSPSVFVFYGRDCQLVLL